MTTTSLARWSSIGAIALLTSLGVAPRACAQSAGSGVIGVSVYVLPAGRADTIPAARMPDWRGPAQPAGPVLVRGVMVHESAVTDDRRPLVIAYVGN